MITDDDLREALDLAVCVAAARRHPGPDEPAAPPRLKQLIGRRPLSKRWLAEARRLVEGAPEFRAFVATKATAEVIGPAAMLWLERPAGWEAAARSLTEDDVPVATDSRADRQREAAERARDRALADVEATRAQLDGARTRIAEMETELVRLQHLVDMAEAQRDVARDAARVAKEKAKTARADERAARVEQRRLHDLLVEAEEVRDRVLADRNAASERDAVIEREASRRASSLPGPVRRDDAPRREPLAIPGGLLGASVEAAQHLITRPDVVLVVDGYNVAKLGWPALELADQRDRLFDAMEALTSRSGVEVLVVLDGADVAVASTTRRLVRVEYSPAGVIADDVIRERVAGLPVRRPVIVATDDQELIRSLRRHGVNLFSSRQLLDLAVR